LDATHKSEQLWDDIFKRLKGEGYAAIEAPVGPFNPFQGNQALFKQLMTETYKFDFIAQIHTCGYPLASHTVEDHVKSFEELVKMAIEWGATFVNAHSGSDTWSLAQSKEFYTRCVQIEKDLKIKVVHETHRRRALFSPFATRDILGEVPELKINLDISHWVVVCERIFDQYDEVWWNNVLKLVTERADFIHARVGYSDGPQVSDPRAPEYAPEVAAHFKWWTAVWTGMRDRKMETAYVEPEHGPAPYMHTLPYTGVPVADLWAVNSWVGQQVKEKFDAFSGATVYKQ